MTKTIAILMFGYLIMGFTDSLNGQSLSPKQKTKLEKQVDSVFHSMIHAAEILDYDKLSQGVDDNLNAGFITAGAYFTRYDSLIDILRTRSNGVSQQVITIQKEKFTALSENIVLLTAFGNSKIMTNDGNFFEVKFYW